jgi:DNA-binding response OmpR family regulator
MPRKTILIIDDETDLCLLLKDYFVRRDYQVAMTHTLREGIDLLHYNTPDILFLDNNLPDGTGWSEASRLAAEFPEMFIVLISAFHNAKPEMPEGARFGVIEKPISIADLDRQFTQLIFNS